MAPINKNTFYKKSDVQSSSSSLHRWKTKGISKDDTIVPPTEVSGTVLSAPASGFSSPKGSTNTPPMLFSSFLQPKVNTRFSRGLQKRNLINSLLTLDPTSEVVSCPPVSNDKKCASWATAVNAARTTLNLDDKENIVNGSGSPRAHKIVSLEPGASTGTFSPKNPKKVLECLSPQAANRRKTSSLATPNRCVSPDMFGESPHASTPISPPQTQRRVSTDSSPRFGKNEKRVSIVCKNLAPILEESLTVLPGSTETAPKRDSPAKSCTKSSTIPVSSESSAHKPSSLLESPNSTQSQPSSGLGKNKKCIQRPVRSCRQSARQKSNAMEDDDDQEEYGNYFGPGGFDNSEGSDLYSPSSNASSISCSSEEAGTVRNNSKGRNPEASDNLSSPSIVQPSPATSAAESPVSSAVQSSALPAKKKGTTELVKTNRKLRNSGQEYQTLTGKTVKGKTMKPLKKCRMKCATRLIPDRRIDIFEEYWGLSDFDKRVTYIGNHVFEEEKQTVRKRVPNSKRNRTCTLRYELEQNNTRLVVCKKCFLATLGENDGFVQRVMENKRQSYSGVTKSDKRGRKPSARKTSQSVIDKIHEHIASFPKYISHYARSQSEKEYLGADLNVNLMFKLYSKGDNPKTSLSVYFREFKKTGLKFKPPAVDTCGKCDAFNQTLKHCSNEEKAAIKEELESHQKKAEDAYKTKKSDKLLSSEDSSKQVIAFDLEQVLPCPQLSSGETFYKRQLSVYNLTVYNCSTKSAVNYMWSEVEAGRGANEIASCVTRYIKEEVAEPVTNLIMYSDTCSGQNKNSHMCAALIAAIKDHPSLDVIDHKFLVPGHTFMECDQVHAQIEKKKRKATTELHHPRDWYNFIRSVPYKNKNLLVREMKQQHFLDYASLLQYKNDGPLVMREKNNDGDHFLFTPVQWFQFRKGNPTTVYYNTDLLSDPSLKINFRRRGKLGEKSLQPKQCHQKRLPISTAKKMDLLSLLPQINPVYHKFYQDLPSSDKMKDVDTDCLPSNVDVSEELREAVAD